MAAVDEITRKKLILVKQLYQQAVYQAARQHSLVGKLMSAVTFDLATETVLKAIVGALDTSKTPSDTFDGLIQQADGVLSAAGYDTVPDKVNIRFVHSVRNDAQHKAKYPTDSVISDCRTYSRDFLQKVVKAVWALSFEGLSLADAIRHVEVKKHLTDAEAKLREGDFEDAIKAANVGLTSGISLVEEVLVGEPPDFFTQFLVTGLPGTHEAEADAYRVLVRMQETLLYVALGMDYSEYMRFRAVAGFADAMLDGSWSYHSMKEKIDADDAEFAVAYCTDAVAQIESLVGDLEAPFGRSR